MRIHLKAQAIISLTVAVVKLVFERMETKDLFVRTAHRSSRRTLLQGRYLLTRPAACRENILCEQTQPKDHRVISNGDLFPFDPVGVPERKVQEVPEVLPLVPLARTVHLDQGFHVLRVQTPFLHKL